jgi:CarD family transcriptional regulator
MQFKVGNFVVHPVYGVGQILKIEEKQFSDVKACLYYKITLSIRSTIWVPVEAQTVIGLRLATTKKDLDQYRHLLKSQPVALMKDHSKRQGELSDRLKEASFQVMCEVVRDLTALDEHKRLSATDRTLLLKTRKNLSQEWAVAANISATEAIQEIDGLLLQTTQQGSMVE